MKFITIYDQSISGSVNPLFIVMPVIMLFIGIALFFLSKKISASNYLLVKRFAVIYMIVVFFLLFFNFSALLKTPNQINLKVVEGIVENFHPMSYNGHDYESFNVKTVKFRYSDYSDWGGFNKTSSHGGPINRNGQHIRITYYEDDNENIILKLEMLEN